MYINTSYQLILHTTSKKKYLCVVRLPDGAVPREDIKPHPSAMPDPQLGPQDPANQARSRGQSQDIKVGTSTGFNPSHFKIPSIFELDLDLLPEKKWKRSGARLADYFNYGSINSLISIRIKRRNVETIRSIHR